LGVLRAPWCGLSLADLHKLVSQDKADIVNRPIPDLLAEPTEPLSAEGQQAVARLVEAVAATRVRRSLEPTMALGSLLEFAWLRLGGDCCVTAAARANLDLLWSTLDNLPGGEEGLLGPALELALGKLTALPDPEASSDYGVQLMSIHKSKGLEFEVVIVPDLQAAGGRSGGKMLSWLERGLAEPDETGAITEFLVAPFQPKGAERGKAKAFVDRVYRERETQEMRRILYVAATRAREALHWFARPAYRIAADGPELIEPANSLLATAWPALKTEVFARFETWKAESQANEPEIVSEGLSIAASASNLLVMPSPIRPTILHRLPIDFHIQTATNQGAPGLDSGTWETENGYQSLTNPDAPSIPRPLAEWMGNHEPNITGTSQLYQRHQGGLVSRALGTAVHALLENFAHLRTDHDPETARALLEGLGPHLESQTRASGLDPNQAAKVSQQALEIALNATRTPLGDWLLAPHPEAASEASWTGLAASRSIRSVRIDRLFRAGQEPLSEGNDCWWIIDYKTAHADSTDPAQALPELRKLFSPQLGAYAQILRNMHGQDQTIRAALYYPRMNQLDCWDA
jgi:ATP-dependent exoDNAse (exonuclease V) beta subunit